MTGAANHSQLDGRNPAVATELVGDKAQAAASMFERAAAIAAWEVNHRDLPPNCKFTLTNDHGGMLALLG